MFSGRQAVSASVLPGSGGTYPGPDYLKRQPTPTASHGQAMSTVQVGNNYEMIFDSEGQDGDAEGMAVHEDLLEKLRKEVGPASPAASIVISDVLPLDEATPYRGDARRSSQVHVSSSAASYTSPQVLAPSIQLPLAAPRASAASSMDLKRLRTRKEPKPISVEVAEAIAVMDQEITEEGRPKKRGRGRPKGSVKASKLAGSAETSENATPVPAQWPGVGARKRGRPSKAPEITMREMYLRSKPKYTPFGCEWYDTKKFPGEDEGKCPAELQNLETLRLHVHLVHGNHTPYVCKWAKCARKAGTDVENYETADALRDHMEEAHLIPYSWHMGDGYQNRGIDTLKVKKKPEELPDYLFKDGIQVTPSVRDQQFEDTAAMQERKKRLREIQRQAQENAPTEQEYRMQLLGVQIPLMKQKESSI